MCPVIETKWDFSDLPVDDEAAKAGAAARLGLYGSRERRSLLDRLQRGDQSQRVSLADKTNNTNNSSSSSSKFKKKIHNLLTRTTLELWVLRARRLQKGQQGAIRSLPKASSV